MANKAKKLPSGSYRCQVYDYTDNNGKKVYRSFTGRSKADVESRAAEYVLNKKDSENSNFTFKEAMNLYIETKSNVLSPASIRGYKQMEKYFINIADVHLSSMNQRIITEWVNEFSKDHSPKTVRNAHGLVTAILKQYAPKIRLNTVLPQKVLPKYVMPSDNDIKILIEHFNEHDKDMLKALYLAAFGTLRRSEICALDANDVSGNRIHVCKAMVKNTNNGFNIKTTKTVSSDRYIDLPQFVIDVLPKKGPIVSVNPDYITHTFGRTLRRLKISTFRFHDLRHYSASIMHAIGVPDQYIMQRGGWQTDTVLKAVYRGTMDDYQKKYTEITNSYFDKISHEISHEIKNAP